MISPSASIIDRRLAMRALGKSRSVNTRNARPALGPDRRKTLTPARPGAEESAKIVSS